MKFSLLKGFEKYDMLLAAVVIGDKKLIFVLDSGSTHNRIASFVYDALKEHFTSTDQKVGVVSIEGNVSYQEMVAADVIMGEVCSETIFSVADMDDVVQNIMNESGIQIHGLLGVPFLRDNNCSIDFGKMEIEIAGPEQFKEAV